MWCVDQRKALLEAAITCLQERGYARTTTRDIVATAGSHLPAVNYYFGSKEKLLGQAVTEALRRWMETTMEVARDPAPATLAERLGSTVERFLSTLESDRAYVIAALEAFAQAPRSEELRDRLAAEYVHARTQVATQVAAASGAIPPAESEASRAHEHSETPRTYGRHQRAATPGTDDQHQYSVTPGPYDQHGSGLPQLDDSELTGVASVLMALFDGLAIQWLLAPDQTLSADQVLRSLELLGMALAESARP